VNSLTAVTDVLSYFVVADLLLALHLDAAAVPSTLTVSVEHCTDIWDRLLALYQRRGASVLVGGVALWCGYS